MKPKYGIEKMVLEPILDLEYDEDEIASSQTTTNQVRISNRSRQTSTWLNNYEDRDLKHFALLVELESSALMRL